MTEDMNVILLILFFLTLQDEILQSREDILQMRRVEDVLIFIRILDRDTIVDHCYCDGSIFTKTFCCLSMIVTTFADPGTSSKVEIGEKRALISIKSGKEDTESVLTHE